MKGWLIVLIILAVLFLIGQLRLGGRVRYDEDGFTLTGIAGPLRLALLPPKERPKKAKKKPPKPKKVKQKPEIAEAHPQKKGGNVGRLMSLLPTVAQAAGAFKRKLCIHRLNLSVVWGGEDAAAIALGYGRANALLGTIWPLLDHNFKVKRHEFQVCLDYGAREPKIAVDAVITVGLRQLLWIGLHYGLKLLIQWSRSGKRTANEQEEKA